jgi:hypothetical protein
MSSSFQNHFITHSYIEWQVHIETQYTLDLKKEKIEYLYRALDLIFSFKSFQSNRWTKKCVNG